MQFISYSFVILWMLAFALYYLFPKKMQWYVLLTVSLLFYIIGLKGFPIGLLLTGVTTYGCGLYLKEKLEEEKEKLQQCADKETKKALKTEFQKKRKRVQILYIAFNLGLLVFYKYVVVALPLVERLTGTYAGFLEKVMMPLGISFYTLTAISYVVDAGRENCAVETNFLKVVLFLAYFPSVTQGPFNRFAPMKEQFEKEHEFQYDRMLRGIQRFIWGAFKKLVIADRLGIFVDRVYGVEPSAVPGSIFACATVFYMLQLYADFSGYIDMAAGVSETFDIMLPDNFKRPYFSKSVAEFWRRWHITLGTWFKDYVMFSFVMSGTGRKISKACKNKWNGMGKQVAPIIGTMLVWFFTGIWHGRTVSYMLWGVYYGVIMSISLVLEPSYAVWKEKLHIRDGKIWTFVRMARTWLIVFVADVLIRSGSMAQAGAIYASFLTRLDVRCLLSREITSYGISKYEFVLLFAVLLIWLMVSVLEERGEDVRTYLSHRPVIVRWVCYYGIVLLLLITGIYGGSYDTAVFMYQSF
ncbi:MAG: hypothetical protein K2J99_07245 [Lachnospiraceae bacterium]|nr:hypothetical protein [Lachnospiraceae bacterium]